MLVSTQPRRPRSIQSLEQATLSVLRMQEEEVCDAELLHRRGWQKLEEGRHLLTYAWPSSGIQSVRRHTTSAASCGGFWALTSRTTSKWQMLCKLAGTMPLLMSRCV